MRVEVAVTAQPMALEDLVEDEAAIRAWYDLSLPRVCRCLLARSV
jgi:hypothetical protein